MTCESLLDEVHTARRRFQAELCDIGEFVEALRRFKKFIRRQKYKDSARDFSSRAVFR
jgi:hypothetical protein